jgi:hypothetical protein
VGLEPEFQPAFVFWRDGQLVYAQLQVLVINQVVFEHGRDEWPIFVAPGGKLGRRQVMRVKAVANFQVCVGVLNLDEP